MEPIKEVSKDVASRIIPAVSAAPASSKLEADAGPDFNIGYPQDEQIKELVSRVVWCLNSGMKLAGVIVKCQKWNQHNSPPIESNDFLHRCFKVERDHVANFSNSTSEVDAVVERFNKSYAWIRSKSRIFRIADNDFIKPGDFRLEHASEKVLAMVRGNLKEIDASDAWLSSPNRRWHESIVYAPGAPLILDNKINLWRGWGCNPIAGDIGPWKALLDHVFAGDVGHRNWFEKWAAYPIQRPGIKLHSGVILWSARHGVGKTMLGETLGRIYGKKNHAVITAKTLHGNFSSWTKSCQFALAEENSGGQKLADSERLKTLITGETIEVHEKFQPEYAIKNCINFMFTSNHANAFYLEQFDRRYFVWEVRSKPLSPAFYADFVDWRDRRGGAKALMDYFLNVDLSGFEPKGHAPMTPAKEAMIENGRTELEQWLAELRADPDHAIATLGGEVISLEKLTDIYNLKNKTRVKPREAGMVLQTLGHCERRRALIRPGSRPWLHAISRVEYWAGLENPAWADEGRKTFAASVLSPIGGI